MSQNVARRSRNALNYKAEWCDLEGKWAQRDFAVHLKNLFGEKDAKVQTSLVVAKCAKYFNWNSHLWGRFHIWSDEPEDYINTEDTDSHCSSDDNLMTVEDNLWLSMIGLCSFCILYVFVNICLFLTNCLMLKTEII